MSKTATVHCAPCHAYYALDEITAKGKDSDKDRLWIEVRPEPSKGGRWSRGKKTQKLSTIEALAQGYQPYCDQGHLLVEALFESLGETYHTVAVIGYPGSSKSCFIAGMFSEVTRFGALTSLGLTASTFPSQDSMIDTMIQAIYEKKTLPGTTEEEELNVGLVMRLQWPGGRRHNLVFYDVSGEVITDMEATAAHARYIYSSAAMVVLADPDGFPTGKNQLTTLGGRSRVSPPLITNLADGFERLNEGTRPSDIILPLVFTVPKADKVGWVDGTYPLPDIDTLDLEGMRAVSVAASVDVAKTLTQAGLGPVMATAKARFGDSNLTFAHMSALGAQPPRPEDAQPGEITYAPNGTWLVVFDVLDALGFLDKLDNPAQS